jgi:hypothetical protein
MTKLEEGGKGLQKSAKVKVKLLKDLKTTKERGSPKKVVEQKSIQQTEKDILTQEKRKQEIENYKENEINWLNDAFWINSGWDGLKGKMKKTWGHKEEYDEKDLKWFFLAHSGDTIKGKPQLVFPTMQRIPLIRLAVNSIDEKEFDEGKGKEIKTGNKINIQSFYFFDEKFDKRHDGFQKEAFAMDFWMYKIITQEGKEVFIWTREQLPNCTCEFKGMLVEMEDLTEMSRNLKVKSIGRIFFLKEFIPDVKILTKEQLVKFTKERNITEEDWFIYLAKHPNGNFNFFPEETEYRRSAIVLSGKEDGYPLHNFEVGMAGSGKTMGHIETLAYKFSEKPPIIEAATSRIKGLEPSYKEKPANIGFLAKAERMGFIDELLKMVENESQRSHNPVNNQLGNLNMFLEHKQRTLVSGFDSDIPVQATAKFYAVANPMSGKSTIYNHIGDICPTFMSRGIWWVQDTKEREFILSEGVWRTPRKPTQDYTLEKNKDSRIENRKKCIVLKMCSGKCIDIMNREEFLTLFDSCYNFTCELDEDEIENLVNTSVAIAREPMKTGVWKPRAFHHVFLLVDGLCKHRCLFRDYDPTFTPKQEDYDLAERILVRMVKSWDTDLSSREDKQW